MDLNPVPWFGDYTLIGKGNPWDIIIALAVTNLNLSSCEYHCAFYAL